MNINSKTIRLGLLSVAFVAIAGCQPNGTTASINDRFEPDNQPRAEQNIFARQTAIAAREDGQLYAHHFTNGELNSLGMAKLNAMFRGPEAGQVKVYLDVAKDDYSARETTINSYLSQKGVSSGAYAIVAGPNLDLGSPVAPGLNGLSKQEAASTTGGQTPPANATGAASH